MHRSLNTVMLMGMTKREQRRVSRSAKPTGAVIYLRVSTGRQARTGVGLEAQEVECRAHCGRLGLAVRAVFSDRGISGKEPVAKRPGLAQAIAAVHANPGAAVVVYSLSRLGRSQRLIWNLLDDRGDYRLAVSSATEPFDTCSPMGRAMLGMLGVWAQLESDLASERTIDALDVLHEKGVKLGAPNMVERTDVDGNRVRDERMVAVVRAIQEAYASGKYSLRSLAEKLNAEQVPTKDGGRWWPTTLRTALAIQL